MAGVADLRHGCWEMAAGMLRGVCARRYRLQEGGERVQMAWRYAGLRRERAAEPTGV